MRKSPKSAATRAIDFDTQVGWGYANATDRRITYPKLSEVWALRTCTGDEDWWLLATSWAISFKPPIGPAM